MIRLIGGEVRKLFTTKLWLWMALGAIALTAMFIGFTIGFDGAEGNVQPRLNTPEGQRNLFAVASAAGIFVLILGIIAITGEFRHQTVTPTFLATPHRGRVVFAKLVIYAVIGVAYGLLLLAFTIAMSLPWLAAKNIDISLSSNGIPGTMVGAVVGVALYAVVGVGIGALVRNQIAAVVGSLVFLFVVEGFAATVPTIRDYYKYFPGGANSALTDATQPGVDLLEPWQGGVLLVGYGVVFAVAGAWTALRRDVS